jgi:hypothetical protein
MFLAQKVAVSVGAATSGVSRCVTHHHGRDDADQRRMPSVSGALFGVTAT